MSVRTLVLGGIRSGKSRWAEQALATAAGAGVALRYVATGADPHPDGGDPSWARRVAAHRARRSARWSTAQSADVAAALRQRPQLPTLVDDLGGWLTAALDRQGWDADTADARDRRLDDATATLLAAVAEFPAELIVVSPEVGLSIVADTASGRLFADRLGSLNQAVAERCDRVVLVVAGQPVVVKPAPDAGGR